MWVKIKTFDHRPRHWNSSGDMDYLMGKTVKVQDSDMGHFFCMVKAKTGGFSWYLKRSDIAEITTTKPKKQKKILHKPATPDLNPWESIYA